jgi:hypothetical protein
MHRWPSSFLLAALLYFFYSFFSFFLLLLLQAIVWILPSLSPLIIEGRRSSFKAEKK